VSIRKLLIYLLVSGCALAQEGTVNISIDDLPSMLKDISPHAEIINNHYNLVKAESDIDLQWSNPELNYTREYVENNSLKETEQLFYVSKNFSMPWNHLQKKKMWDAELNAAGLDKEQSKNNLLASARTAYVHLALLDKQAEKHSSIKNILSDLGAVVNSRQQEGAISSLEAELLSMTVFALEADIIKMQKQNKQAEMQLRQLLGISESTEIKLNTAVVFNKIQFDVSSELFTNDSPGLKARQKSSEALKYSISMEKGNIFPYVTLSGGYKTIDKGWEGYTLGLSLPLPLLNFNRPQIEKQETKLRILDLQNSLYKQELQSRANILTSSVKTSMELLSKQNGEPYSAEILENLKVAYREGTVTLAELLSMFNIYRDSYKEYSEQLLSHYQAVFELEALSGRQLITF